MRPSDSNSFDVSTRRKRRIVMAFIIDMLARMKSAEEAFIDNVPENLKEGVAVLNADMSIDCILEAIDILNDAY